MTSARAACLPLRLAFAGRNLRPLELPRPAPALAFLDKVCGPLGGHVRARHRAYVAHTAKKTWIGRVNLVEPGHDDLRLLN
jgi:hypothetical protein